MALRFEFSNGLDRITWENQEHIVQVRKSHSFKYNRPLLLEVLRGTRIREEVGCKIR